MRLDFRCSRQCHVRFHAEQHLHRILCLILVFLVPRRTREPPVPFSTRHLNTLKTLGACQQPIYQTKGHVQEYTVKRKPLQRQVACRCPKPLERERGQGKSLHLKRGSIERTGKNKLPAGGETLYKLEAFEACIPSEGAHSMCVPMETGNAETFEP